VIARLIAKYFQTAYQTYERKSLDSINSNVYPMSNNSGSKEMVSFKYFHMIFSALDSYKRATMFLRTSKHIGDYNGDS